VHAVMEYIDGTWHIRDANSTYGTLVNSAKVGATLTPLSNGDELSLGPTFRMSYRIHEPTGTRAYTQVMPSTSGGTPRLRSTAGMPTDQLFQIRRQIEVLGRGNDASLRIPVDGSTGVSSRHASLERLPNGWQVRDLDSANGTFIDGQALPRGGSRTVEIGVRIGLGPQVTLVLEE
jgi:pSer/pThr/pTyr-binding forkhead associated (FHA) protein